MRSKVLICLISSLFLLTGCTSSKLEKNMAKVEENSSTYYAQYQSEYEKEVKELKKYEMNIILSLREGYDWNYYRQGEFFDESEFQSIGVYSKDFLKNTLGLSKEQVLSKIDSETAHLSAEGLAVQYTPTIDEKLAIANISISYYLATTDNYESFGLSTNGVDSSKNIMQVVTITCDYGIYEGCFVWRDGQVIDAQEINNF